MSDKPMAGQDEPTSISELSGLVIGFKLEPGLRSDEEGAMHPNPLLGLAIDSQTPGPYRVQLALRPDLLPQLAEAFALLAREWPRLEKDLQRIAAKTPTTTQRQQ